VSGTIAIVLNYRTPRDTITAVRSLEASNSATAATIVVDNASRDGSAELLATELPNVRLILADTNGGFSSGCNLGIREALQLGAQRVLLLNSDVIVPSHAVGALERALAADPALGIVAPILVSHSDPEVVQSLGIRFSQTTGRMLHIGSGVRRAAVPPFERRDVDGVSGCAMLVKRDVFERIGLLTEEYFFGFEDLDFCLRARADRFQTACIGTATVRHYGNLSIGRASERRIYFATRNHLLLAHRCAGLQSRSARWLQTAAILGFNLAHVLFTADVPRSKGLAGLMRGARDHFAGRYGPDGSR
jgi:GT2 family glycosyltransferase